MNRYNRFASNRVHDFCLLDNIDSKFKLPKDRYAPTGKSMTVGIQGSNGSYSEMGVFEYFATEHV